MEGGPVIKSFFGQFNEIIHMIGRDFREKLEFDLSKLGLNNCPGIRHFLNFLLGIIFKSGFGNN